MRIAYKVGLFFITATVISLILIVSFQKKFDAESWKNEPDLRYKMVDDILESKIFIGNTRDEIKMLLGAPKLNYNQQDIYFYQLGQPERFFKNTSEILVLYFNEDRVIKVHTAFHQ